MIEAVPCSCSAVLRVSPGSSRAELPAWGCPTPQAQQTQNSTKQPTQAGLAHRLSWHSMSSSVGVATIGKEKRKGLCYWCVSYTWPVNWQNTSVCCLSHEPSKAQNIHQATLGFSGCSSVVFWRVERTDMEDDEKILRLFYRFLYIFF